MKYDREETIIQYKLIVRCPTPTKWWERDDKLKFI